jgi:hypothetical protein
MNHFVDQTRSAHVELASPEDIKRVMGSVSGLMTLATLKISSGLIPDNEITTWQARIDKHLSACGCKQSALGMMSLASLYAVFYFLGGGELGGIGVADVLSCVVFAVVGAAIGKLGGVAYGRLTLKRTLESLLQVLQNRKPTRSA